jgi:hypothetical protein
LWRRPESARWDVRGPIGNSSKEEAVLRRLVLLFWAMAATLLMASGAALAEDIKGTEGPDNLVGTTGEDTIDGREGGDFILGESVLFAAGGTDTLTGGPGDDEVYGRGGDDEVSGGSGNDEVAGTLGSDVVYGDDGDDLVDSGAPFDALGDALYGGAGNDVMDAYQRPAVTDVVICGPGTDIVYTDGADIISSNCETAVLGPSPDPWDLALLNAL